MKKIRPRFSLNDLESLKNNFPVSLPEYTACLENLIATRRNFLLDHNSMLENALKEPEQLATKDQLWFVKLVVEWGPLAIEVMQLKSSRGFLAQFFLPNGDCKGHGLKTLQHVFAIVCHKFSFIWNERELAIVEKLITIVESQLDYLAVVDLCFCKFTNGSDAERVKEMTRKETPKKVIKI